MSNSEYATDLQPTFPNDAVATDHEDTTVDSDGPSRRVIFTKAQQLECLCRIASTLHGPVLEAGCSHIGKVNIQYKQGNVNDDRVFKIVCLC